MIIIAYNDNHGLSVANSHCNIVAIKCIAY